MGNIPKQQPGVVLTHRRCSRRTCRLEEWRATPGMMFRLEDSFIHDTTYGNSSRYHGWSTSERGGGWEYTQAATQGGVDPQKNLQTDIPSGGVASHPGHGDLSRRQLCRRHCGSFFNVLLQYNLPIAIPVATMGGARWSKDEEKIFWTNVVKKSKERLNQSAPEKTWEELAEYMNTKLAEKKNREELAEYMNEDGRMTSITFMRTSSSKVWIRGLLQWNEMSGEKIARQELKSNESRNALSHKDCGGPTAIHDDA